MDRFSNPDERSRIFDQLVESTTDVLWMFSSEWDEAIFVNSAYEEVWGRSSETLEKDPTDFFEGIHPDDRDAVKTGMTQLSDGDSVELEYRVNPEDEYQRWVRAQGDPIYDETGEVVRVVGIAHEITDQKATGTELARYRTIVENITDGIYLFDADDSLSYVNPAAVEASSLSRDQMLGRSRADLVEATLAGETTVEDVSPTTEAVLDGDKEEIRHTLRFETADGPKPFHVRTTRGETADGECIGTISVVRDISDRVEIEQELRRKNERLDEFVSIVSHDLRNPLNVARGHLDLVQKHCDSEYLDEVSRAHERMEALIGDLLTLARQGDQIAGVEAVALDDLVTECWSTVATGEATLGLESNGVVRADPTRLRQLFENLFRNAVEHAGPDVTIRVGRLADSSGFYVADDGPGIAADQREAVFDHGHSTSGGTGFGLSIVAEVADAHGWEISTAEATDGGARFEITGVEFAE